MKFTEDGKTLTLKNEQRKFTLIFEGSEESLDAYISQEGGKAIMSLKKQTELGHWILERIFKLPPYQPLTAKRLKEIGINAIRLTKESENKVRLSFSEIDEKEPPKDFWPHTKCKM